MRETFDWYGWPLRQDSLFFESENGGVVLRPTDLLVAIDETGIEDFSDPQYPLFGLGGCAVYAGLYLDALCLPWLKLKKQYFGSGDTPLHAADLHGNQRIEAAAAIGEFFRHNGFFRLAAITTATTVSDGVIDPYTAVAMQLMGQLAVIQRIAPFDRVVFIFEGSQRTDGLAARVFQSFEMTYEVEGTTKKVELIYWRGTKALNYSALEVADFIMHAAGTAVRASRSGTKYMDRKDFAAVFGAAPDYLSHFVCLSEYGIRSKQ